MLSPEMAEDACEFVNNAADACGVVVGYCRLTGRTMSYADALLNKSASKFLGSLVGEGAGSIVSDGLNADNRLPGASKFPGKVLDGIAHAGV